MSTAKIAITMREDLLRKLDRLVRSKAFPSRSRAVQEAVEEKLAKNRPRRSRPGNARNWIPNSNKHWQKGAPQEKGWAARILRGEIYWARLDPAKGHEQAGDLPHIGAQP